MGEPAGQRGTSSAPLSARQRFDWTLDPPQDGSFRPLDPLLNLREEVTPAEASAASLSDFRESEGRLNRLARLKSLFENLSPSAQAPTPSTSASPSDSQSPGEKLQQQRAVARQAYAEELWVACGGKRDDAHRRPEWDQFREFAERKEAELWQVFRDIDSNKDGRLSEQELHDAVSRAGIDIPQETIRSFIRTVDKDRNNTICFEEWRDFLLLLPRPADIPEIFRFYSARGPTRIATSVVTQDGDVTMGASGSGWARGKRGLATELGLHVGSTSTAVAQQRDQRDASVSTLNIRDEPMKDQGSVSLSEKAEGKRKAEEDGGNEKETKHEDEKSHPFEGAGKFLFAGGIAGAVSRTATAPFDRLKVYLITDSSYSSSRPEASGRLSKQEAARPDGTPAKSKVQLGPTGTDALKQVVKSKDPMAVAGATSEATKRGTRNMMRAVRSIHAEGGMKGFFVGNGLNVLKIFPESATKFLTYELSKRAFARYVDKVPDQGQISGSSRFIAGGIGGVASQFAIYPVETLKTRVMSSTSSKLVGNALLLQTAREMWKSGGTRAYYSGLVAALVGVFPYSAIDMSAFEGLKGVWVKTLGDEPGVLGTLMCGALSGGVGATSVYPLNLVRTRLQAQGSPSHPQRYTGIRDCAVKTFQNEGVAGLYKGLTPSLLKVVPAVSISWACYDSLTKFLDVGA